MDIKSINCTLFSKGSSSSMQHDGICHIKTLPYLSIAQAVDGSYDIRLGAGKTHNTGTCGFFLAPANIQQTITHHSNPASGHMHCRWVFLKIQINGLYDFDSLYEFPTILPDAYKDAMHRVFERLFSATDLFSEYICYYEIAKILSCVSQEKEHTLPAQLDDVLAYIKAHYADPITVADIAKSAKLSQSHLFSVFKKHLGVSPIAYLNNYRLSAAVTLLSQTNRTIVEIADMVGIHDSVYFNKLFRKAYQMPPSKYREIYKMQ